MQQYIATAGPKSFAQADLLGALTHRHQHDVHDADAADQQRDGTNGSKHQGEATGDRAHNREGILLGAHGKIVFPQDPVPLAQQVGDLKARSPCALLVAGFDADEIKADPVGGVASR